MSTHFVVRKGHLQETLLQVQPDAPLAAGQVRVSIDRFALTANNITYGAFGDAMHYWDFFPVQEEGWGVIPVWGFGTVVQSDHPGVAVGERLYGYFPMASSVVLAPGRLSVSGFTDTSAHRVALPRVYNQYLRCGSDPFHASGTEDVQALLRPLFITSWLIDDFLADNDFFGARTLVLSSASSKTAYGTAFMLAQRAGVEVVGLTSPANQAFCESLGCYHRVVAYGQLDQIDAGQACVYVDFAGNAALRTAVHTRFGDLRYSCSIGGTHVAQLGSVKDLPGPRPVLFFAPSQITRRHGEWGADGLEQRLVRSWTAFVEKATHPARPWLTVERHSGGAAVQSAYLRMLAGQGDPRLGLILSL
jgi:hypothetical protein